MTHAWKPSGLPPELLAAYADGALAGTDLERVVDWLADHPEARLEILEMQRLQELMERSQPPEPRSAVWAGVVDRVHAGLQAPPRRRWPVGAYAGAAAAALACVSLGWTLPRRGDRPADKAPATAARMAELERRLANLEERAVTAERNSQEASQRADEASCLARQAEDRASDAERHAEATADMASTPHLDLLSHDQVRLLTPSQKFRLDDWATPMVVDPVLNVRGP